MIKFLNEPFPHIVATDFYNEEELFLIKQELNFLFSPRKLQPAGVHHSTKELTNSRALILEFAYKMPEISDILQITKKTLDAPFVSTVCNMWPQFARLKHINKITTKVRYYHHGEAYVPHIDVIHDFLTFSYFHSTPKKFSGGEIYFPQYNYEIECNDNTMILIPSYVEHGVKEVFISHEEYWNGNGRYCISQFMDLKNTAYDE